MCCRKDELLVFWDFDGTLIPFDSEQFLLETLFIKRKKSLLRSLLARLFIYGDRHGWHPGLLKVIYGWCLRGSSLAVLDEVCARIATYISPADRTAIRSLADKGLRMTLLSCGTADLIQRTLRAAGLEDCFERIEANSFITHDTYIAGIERRIYLPETKVDIAAERTADLQRVIAVGDGLTDLPLLDHVGLPVLIAKGEQAGQLGQRRYHVVNSLGEAIAIIAQKASLPCPRSTPAYCG